MLAASSPILGASNSSAALRCHSAERIAREPVQHLKSLVPALYAPRNDNTITKK
jgi:hypothetical protein